MDAVDVTVVSLAEDDSLERLVEGDGDLHQVLLALDVEAGDLGHVLLRLRPGCVLWLGGCRLDICRGRVVGHSDIVRGVGLLRGHWWSVLLLLDWLGVVLKCNDPVIANQLKRTIEDILTNKINFL